MPTLKAIHICNSPQPTRKPKIAKEYVFANAEKGKRKHNNVYSAYPAGYTPYTNLYGKEEHHIQKNTERHHKVLDNE